MNDADLIECASGFRDGVLGRQSSDLMCAAVCWPLTGFLRFSGVDCDTEDRQIDEPGYPANHVWVRLADGRVLDPTADQFSPLGLPPVYLGKPVAPIHRPMKATTAVVTLNRIQAALLRREPSVEGRAYPESEGEVPPCDGCGGSTRYWHATNRLWNLVMGGPDAKGDPGGVLCPNCFIDRAASLGLGRRWVVSDVDPDEITVETIERVMRERIHVVGTSGAAQAVAALWGRDFGSSAKTPIPTEPEATDSGSRRDG